VVARWAALCFGVGVVGQHRGTLLFKDDVRPRAAVSAILFSCLTSCCILLGCCQLASAEETKSRIEDIHSTVLAHPNALNASGPELQKKSDATLSQQAKPSHVVGHDGAVAHHTGMPEEFNALLNYVRELDPEQPQLISAAGSDFHHGLHEDPAYSALRDFAAQLEGKDPKLILAQTSKPPAAKPRPAAKPKAPIINGGESTFVGPQVCMECHSRQTEAFNATLMGKVFKNPRNSLEAGGCETCHGPGSAHVKAVGCAACHGEGGITSKPGTPNLVGLDPQYLVPAMRAYVTGQRKHSLKRLILSGIGPAEANNIAHYYARQPAARAQTPLIGDPSGGRKATGLCAGCHGERGISIVPAWPSLAGQDSLYLANAIRAYKHGARTKAIACSACHGEGGVSRIPGMPSLVGQHPQYLVPAMKAYVNGEREHALMKALLQGVSDSELNNIALYYAGQTPARAHTPTIGNPAAGKTAAVMCTGCHGAESGSLTPAWPTLAGQDAQYLADAINAYKSGSRDKTVACAACHGERGISKTPGMPSLVGLDAQYLVAAMKAYVSGQRKHDLMKGLLVGVSEGELNKIAQYYAQQAPDRAQTPTVGDSAAGKTASAACASCHGEQGVSSNPAWPSLAGQDANYLVAATRAYKDGSRTDATMKALVASLDDATINNLAGYYASLRPAQPAPNTALGPPATRDPVVVSNGLVASLDQQTINDIVGYFATLRPTQPAASSSGAGHDPVLIRNGLVAWMDDRTIDSVSSYYATLQPAQPERPSASAAIPARVGIGRPIDKTSLGGIISFRADDPGRKLEDNNAICLGCHEKGARTLWSGSTHEVRNVACTNCHVVMRNITPKFQLAKLTEMDTCFQCHKDKRAQIWRSSHMPVREKGGMTCSSCHNPHGSYGESLLKQATINDGCYQCHAEKRGPFLYEHAPVRENCLNCHEAHGSNNDFLLKISRPRLCQSCHANVTGHPGNPRNPASLYAFNRECQNCHSQHHGSNTPGGGARWNR
jgi:DmsE family decaheme c-type cytochrome